MQTNLDSPIQRTQCRSVLINSRISFTKALLAKTSLQSPQRRMLKKVIYYDLIFNQIIVPGFGWLC